MRQMLYELGKRYVTRNNISSSVPSAFHAIADNEVFFTYPLASKILLNKVTGERKDVSRVLRVIAQYDTTRKAIIIMWREPEQSFNYIQLTKEESVNFGATGVELDPKITSFKVAAKSDAELDRCDYPNFHRD